MTLKGKCKRCEDTPGRFVIAASSNKEIYWSVPFGPLCVTIADLDNMGNNIIACTMGHNWENLTKVASQDKDLPTEGQVIIHKVT